MSHATARIVPFDADAGTEGFAEDVRRDLARTPKQLQSKYLYDSLGSCLFEAICRLPWYRLTQAEQVLLDRHGESVVGSFADPLAIIELGCGSGEKVASLAAAMARSGRSLRIHLVDVSAAALVLSGRTLGGLPGVSMEEHCTTYEDGLRRIAVRRDPQGPLLTLLLGSNLGNFDPPGADAFLRRIRTALRPGDGLLLGTDLVKARPALELAYDDPLGVTAAFNKNLLARINRELDADFDLGAFDHRVVWNETASRIEMHLQSRRAQVVRIPGAGCVVAFEAGERIWTESSYKYSAAAIAERVEEVGFRSVGQWIEAEARFALTLFRAS